MKINRQSDGIKIDGHIGEWYVISESYHNGIKVFLLEHEEYGDEAPSIITDANGKVILTDVWNGFSDLDN